MKRLYRSKKNKMIAGVCGGIGEYFDIDPALVRLIFLVLLFSGIGFLLYLVAWIIIPPEPNDKEELKEGTKETTFKAHQTLGIILVVVGALLLIDNFYPYFEITRFWPLALTLLGLWLIFKRTP